MLLRSLEHRRRQHPTWDARVSTLPGHSVVSTRGSPDRARDRRGCGILGARGLRATGGARRGDQQDALWFAEKDQRFVGETLYSPLTVFPCASAASVRLAFRASARLAFAPPKPFSPSGPALSDSAASPSSGYRSEERRVGKECRSRWS